MRSPFPIVHDKYSLVFQCFAPPFQQLKITLSFVYGNNTVVRAASVYLCCSVPLTIERVRYFVN